MQQLDWIINIVYDLNQEIFELFNEEDQAWDAMEYTIEMKTNGDVVVIKFLGQHIWNSEDDERQTNEETEDYEHLDIFLRREINKLMNTIKRINL